VSLNRYYIAQFGTCLPSSDSHKDERAKELQAIQNMYQYGQTAPDLPVQVSKQIKTMLVSKFRVLTFIVVILLVTEMEVFLFL